MTVSVLELERVNSGSACWGSSPYPPAKILGNTNGRAMSNLAAWALAPEWVTPAQAAVLMGNNYTPDTIRALIELGAVDAEEDAAGAWRVETRSLREYQDALWEVSADEHER